MIPRDEEHRPRSPRSRRPLAGAEMPARSTSPLACEPAGTRNRDTLFPPYLPGQNSPGGQGRKMSQGMRKHHCPKFVEKQNHRSQIDGIDGGDSAMSGVDTRIIMASSRTATATRQVTVRGRGMAVADDQPTGRRRTPRHVVRPLPPNVVISMAESSPSSTGSTSATFGDRRMYGGRIRLVNRCRVPSSSTRRSFTRGARTCIVPAPQVTERGRAWPLRTTRRRPFSACASRYLVDLFLHGCHQHAPRTLAGECIQDQHVLDVVSTHPISPW